MVDARRFGVWQKLRVGGWDVDRATAALKSGRCLIGGAAARALRMTPFSSIEAVVSLIRVTGSDLGLTEAVPRWMIYEAAMRQGLCRCPAEVGLRLGAQQQPASNGCLFVASEPFVSDDVLNLWYVVGFAGSAVPRGINVADGNPDGFWLPSREWVFCYPPYVPI